MVETSVTINGPEIIPRLQQAVAKLSSEKRALDSSVATIEERVKQLVQQREVALLELARFHLPELKRMVIESTSAEVRFELFGVLAKLDAQKQVQTSALERVNDQIAQQQTQLGIVTEKLNGLVRQRQTLEPLVAAELAKHPRFLELTKLAEQARETLKRNQARVAELQQTAKEKLPAYERSALFQYLYRRQFSTPQYTSRGLTQRLDGWVARMVDYPNSRRGYEFLRRSPEVLRKELERRQQDFEVLVSEMQAIDSEVASAAGLTTVREQGTECGRQRDALVAGLRQQQDQARTIQNELQQLNSGQNKFYEEALARLQRFFSQTNASVLAARARQTPEPEDDQLVATIASYTAELDQSKPRLANLTQEAGGLTERMNVLQRLISRCRQQNFDSDRSYFESLNLESLATRLASGGILFDEAWQTLRTQQRFRPTETSTVGSVVADSLANQMLLNMAVDVISSAAQASVHSHHSHHFGSSSSDSMSSSSGIGGGGFSGSDSTGSSFSSGGGISSGGSFTSGEGF